MEGIEIVIVHMKIEVVVSSYLETATHISSKIEHHKSRSHIISCFGILIFLIASLWFYLFLGVDVCHCLSSTPSLKLVFFILFTVISFKKKPRNGIQTQRLII